MEIIYEKGLKCEEHYLGAVVGRESRMIKTRYVVKVKEVSVGITVCYFPDTFSEKDDNEGYHNVFVRKI